ncbi:MAG: hypothetical protein ABSA65_16535 [Acidimicrobiales bacterium]|jgi:hypothetical protein
MRSGEAVRDGNGRSRRSDGSLLRPQRADQTSFFRSKYLTSWSDARLDDQVNVPLDADGHDLLARIAKENRGKYSGCWDVLEWKGERTLFIEAKHNKVDHIRVTQLQWRWAALRAGLKADDFVVAQWEFDERQHAEVR